MTQARVWVFALSLMATLVSGCATKLKAPGPSNMAYPHGTYQHKVQVQINQPARTIDMRGVIQSKPEELKVVGISSFGTTVFRIDDNFKTGELNKEFYVEALRRNEERFMFFYTLLKDALLARKGQTEFEKEGAKFALSNPDENQIYRTITVTHPQVNVKIEVSSYDF